VESDKRIRVLYVCPWAHWAGHAPHAIAIETAALTNAGAEVYLCTFRDFPDQERVQSIPHKKVTRSRIAFPADMLSRLLHRVPRGRGLAWFIEQSATLYLAIKLRKTVKYDVIFLRDGDPFIFIPFVLGLFRKRYAWAITLLGVPQVRPPDSLYNKFINSSIWKPVYHRGFAGNEYLFICENRYIKEHFESRFLNGILAGSVRLLPRGVESMDEHTSQKEARQLLGLPENKTVLLHFGAVHPEKDIKVIFGALKEMPDVIMVIAGKVALSINLTRMVQDEGLDNRVIIRNFYVPESEKKYYFAAADAIVLSYKRNFIQTASMVFEAAQFMLPAIASNAGELGELVSKYQTGYLFDAEESDSFKDALSRFLSSGQDERDTIMSSCEKLCRDYSIEQWAARCMDIFMELCKRENKRC